MLKSWLPEGGTNLFQAIREKCIEAEKRGIRLLKLSIGQPTGPALLSARKAAAKAVMSDDEIMHGYQDNGSPGVPNFAQRFAQYHVECDLSDNKNVDYLPISGIKPMLGLIPLACDSTQVIEVAVTTKPGYPTPKDWCDYLGKDVLELSLNPENAFRFPKEELYYEPTLIMMNYPHNPSGQIAVKKWLQEICEECIKAGTRIFNDAAYIALSHKSESCTLTDVAIDLPELSWAEAFSASKLIANGTGWRIGAIVGSPDFVGDIKTIKGNTDSGFVAPMAAGVIAALENDREGINECRETYNRRLKLLIKILTENGMQLAVEPGAGFFTLWKTPTKAFGQEVKDAQDFNFKMIERTGIVGVHFHPYIRYAVCGNIETMAKYISASFRRASVNYE